MNVLILNFVSSLITPTNSPKTPQKGSLSEVSNVWIFKIHATLFFQQDK